MGDQTKYVVLLGDSGSGKSTLVEKLTGERGRSSDSSQSFTETSEGFSVPDGSLVVCDTPGVKTTTKNFQQESWFVDAMEYFPVWKILVTVKADPRVENVVHAVNKYAEKFFDMEDDQDDEDEEANNSSVIIEKLFMNF